MPPRRAIGARGGDGGTAILHHPPGHGHVAALRRDGRHTHRVEREPQGTDAAAAGEAILERLVPLLDATHQVWSSPQERRRLRAFGFRPAVEPGVLKREWHGTQVRVGPDALRVVANGVNALHSPEKAAIVVTHYQRLLEYIVPDYVHVLYKGRIVRSGGKELALELEEKGYDWVKDEAVGAAV